MALLQQPIQRKLSALLGAEVTFEKLNLSLLSGTIDAVGVTVAGEDRATPVLTVARVRVDVSVTRALKGEIVVKSLAIERPVVTIVRRSDGTTNLPKRIKAEPAAVEAAPDAPPGTDEPEEGGKSSWKLDAEKVLLVDGEIELRLDDYHLIAKPLLAELKRAGDGYALTLLIDSVCRAGHTANGLSVRCSGMIQNAADLTAVPQSPASMNVEVGDLAKIAVTTPSLASRDLDLDASGAAEVGRLLALLPPGLRLPPMLTTATGRIEFSAKARMTPAAGLRASELVIRATDVAVDL